MNPRGVGVEESCLRFPVDVFLSSHAASTALFSHLHLGWVRVTFAAAAFLSRKAFPIHPPLIQDGLFVIFYAEFCVCCGVFGVSCVCCGPFGIFCVCWGVYCVCCGVICVFSIQEISSTFPPSAQCLGSLASASLPCRHRRTSSSSPRRTSSSPSCCVFFCLQSISQQMFRAGGSARILSHNNIETGTKIGMKDVQGRKGPNEDNANGDLEEGEAEEEGS